MLACAWAEASNRRRRGRPKPIFISYRREDEPGYAGWLYLLAAADLSEGRIFKDIEGGLRDGDDFPDELARRVDECDIVLAVIGPKWLTSTDPSGRRRFDNPDDWVRIEIATALVQQKRVIPMLVDGADFVRAEGLPEGLRPLARKYTRRPNNDRFAPEVKALIAGLPEMLAAVATERADGELRAAAEAERKTMPHVRGKPLSGCSNQRNPACRPRC